MVVGKPCGLGPEQESIARLKLNRGIKGRGGRRKGENARVREGSEAGVDIGVDDHVGQVVIVQARAAQMLIIQGKPQGLNKVQSGTRARAHADRIAGIGRNDRIIEDDMQF